MAHQLRLLTLTILAAFMLLAFLPACDTAQSRARKIVSLRTERKEMLDKLYREYGGSDLSQSIKTGLQKESESGNDVQSQIVQGLANLTQGADRTIFEQNIRIVGSGENLVALTDKAKQYFSRPVVIKASRKVYEMDVELEQLQRKEN
jgi:hypothetical protein